MSMLLPSTINSNRYIRMSADIFVFLAAICLLTVATVSRVVSNPDDFLLNLCDGVGKFLTPLKTLAEAFTNTPIAYLLPIHLIAYESPVLTS
ncbi:hypothetical protein TNCV_2442721 [Trichonephila clavipes]|nr:hypothetical protein TNCV_2442721 [Trichonephila clavipes]